MHLMGFTLGYCKPFDEPRDNFGILVRYNKFGPHWEAAEIVGVVAEDI
jgi:hypothetical protein